MPRRGSRKGNLGMSSKIEASDEGGQKAPSESVEDGRVAALAQLLAHVTSTAIGHDGVLTPQAKAQIDLRDADERSKFLENLLVEVCPNGVDPDLWEGWLNGGTHCFGERLKKAGPGAEKPIQTLTRTPPRVVKQEEKIAEMRAALEAEERRLIYYKAHQSAALQWYVTDHLISIMAPAIAMGPAWTVMRAISGYMSAEDAHRNTLLLEGKAKDRAIQDFRGQKQAESDELMEALDHWSGDPGFEKDLRAAIKNVIADYADRREKRVQSGRPRRSHEKMRTTIHPEAKMDAKDVLSGLKGREGKQA